MVLIKETYIKGIVLLFLAFHYPVADCLRKVKNVIAQHSASNHKPNKVMI